MSPGPGSGHQEHEFKRLAAERKHYEHKQLAYIPCDICGWRAAVTVGPQGQLEYAPLTCQSCKEELEEMESGA